MDSASSEAAAEAFERFVVPELAVLARVARSITGHHADGDDLVQDTLLRAYRSIDRFDGRARAERFEVPGHAVEGIVARRCHIDQRP